MTRIWAALIAAITTGFLSSFVVPAAAWAEESGVAEQLRRRPLFGGFFGFLGLLCCVVVVGGIVVAVVLMTRRRR